MPLREQLLRARNSARFSAKALAAPLKRPRSPLITMDAAVKAQVEMLFNPWQRRTEALTPGGARNRTNRTVDFVIVGLI